MAPDVISFARGAPSLDITYGARPLRRVIQRHLVNPLSTMLLEGEYLSGDTVRVTVSETGQFSFEKG